MRKLVTIRTVSEVNPIEGADAIECLTVEGWKVVSQKGNFKPGDPCVYFEIDSFLPEGNELWDDLVAKSSREFEGKRGHVLRTIKLRGQVSQGWCIPIFKFPEIIKALGLNLNGFEWDDARKRLVSTSEEQKVAEEQMKTIHDLDLGEEIKQAIYAHVNDALSRRLDMLSSMHDFANANIGEHFSKEEIYEMLLDPEKSLLMENHLKRLKFLGKELAPWLRNRDFADLLGVLKYEAPIPAELAGQVKGAFPSNIKKTDQERVQNIAPEVFADLDARYEVSIKLDGSSCTIYDDPDREGGVCSRNLELKNNEENAGNSFVRVANETKLVEFLREVLPMYAVQGELMGPGIQGNREQLKKHELFIFDIYDIAAGKLVDPVTRHAMFDLMQHHGVFVNHVPLLNADVSLRELGFYEDMTTEQAVAAMLELAEGKSLKHDVREGLVFKRLDGQFSFKVISNKFLLKQKE